ncbi:MAG: DapH/DapD/GlmU-related protein [Cyclobacteriaceae bacterium]
MITIKELLATIDYIEFVGDENCYIEKPVQLTSSVIETTDILWVSNKFLDKIEQIKKGVIICSDQANRDHFSPNCSYIITKNPRRAFSQMLSSFFVIKESPGVSRSAIIHSNVIIPGDSNIGNNVVIEQGVSIGAGCVIGHNTIIKHGTVIGNGVKIGCNCTIGGVGFGYEKDEDGQYLLIPHIGNVVIGDSVEIGNNTAIDRAVMGSTRIGENCKIDNLVHIAHGVQLGRNSLVIANAMVAGSVVVGENVWIAPSSSILNGIAIGDNALIGVGAVVLKPVSNEQIVVGNPAKPLNRRQE